MKCKTCNSYALNIASESGYCDVCYYKHHLFNILAIIHCDGGHYTGKYGVDKSVKKAVKTITNKIIK